MNNIAKHAALVLSATLALDLGTTSAFAQVDGYVQAPVSGVVVKDSFGLCWRTGYWTPAMATMECDPELMPKKAESAPAPVATPPAPQPTPPAARKRVTEEVMLSADTLFAFDKAVLRPGGKLKLDHIVDRLKGVDVETIIVIGYTDRIGGKAYNLRLSNRRAEAVKVYLVSKGAPADRILAEGKGKENPVTQPGQCKGPKSAKVIKCLQPDRRVELEVHGSSSRYLDTLR